MHLGRAVSGVVRIAPLCNPSAPCYTPPERGIKRRILNVFRLTPQDPRKAPIVIG
ncbi:protein of unknown function (plasmid) [Cupriavidus taiwanensis]|uniref:Uncharacterized protein n=1 Tax=Cupriavidus taiwanensis TaxID=164546 RepID=A0A7Z7JJH4_9BURK|nr:hypothetical protein CBM2597_U40002 [Cupriavidus taiwanensis]SOZ97206.1 hypothetical protein CBM2598_U40002 [Cupriavidus taiwanensis]SPC26097.1 hypothetical protein CBM2594_U40002 [Cupriavidus taiwanensis]SPD37770.1 protein of unknown function [Cupriavidus taiwanensis]